MRSLARMALAGDLSATGVERRQPMQRPGPSVCVLHAMGEPRVGRPRGLAAWPRLPGGLLSLAPHAGVGSQGPHV
jgi:hypothetical protein